jgi:hypothetical protein
VSYYSHYRTKPILVVTGVNVLSTPDASGNRVPSAQFEAAYKEPTLFDSPRRPYAGDTLFYAIPVSLNAKYAGTDADNTFTGVNTFADTLKSLYTKSAWVETTEDAMIGRNLTVAGNTYLGNEGTDTIFADAPILMAEGYVPTNPRHVATKGYVDGLANRRHVEATPLNWTVQQQGQYFWCGVDYGDGKFIAVDYDSGNIGTSTDGGETWTITNLGTYKWRSVTYGGGTWLIGDVQGNLGRSTDGVNWTFAKVSNYRINRTAYANGIWIMAANSGYYARSEDEGVTWTFSQLYTGDWLSAMGDGKGNWGLITVVDRLHSHDNGMSWAGDASNSAQTTTGSNLATGSMARARELLTTSDYFVDMSYDGGYTYGKIPFDFCVLDLRCREGVWIATGSSMIGASMDDGVTWTTHAIGGNTWRAGTVGDGVAIAVGWSGRIARCKVAAEPHTYLIATKAYADSVLGNRTVDWADIQNKPFETVGDGLIVDEATNDRKLSVGTSVARTDRDNSFSGDNDFAGVNTFGETTYSNAPVEYAENETHEGTAVFNSIVMKDGYTPAAAQDVVTKTYVDNRLGEALRALEEYRKRVEELETILHISRKK